MPNNKNKVSIRDVYELVDDFRREIRDSYVTKAEFLPVKAISYGIIGMAATAVMIGILAKVVQAIY